MFDLTLIVLDVIIAIVLIILGNSLINSFANRYNWKLTIFKLENLSTKEQLNNLTQTKEEIELEFKKLIKKKEI